MENGKKKMDGELEEMILRASSKDIEKIKRFCVGIELNANKGMLAGVLEEIPEDKLVFIGAQSSFLFIGPRRDALSYLPDISKRSLKKLNKVKSDYEQQIRNLGRMFSTFPDSMPNYDLAYERFHTAYGGLHATENSIRCFIPIEDRRVIDIYERIEGDGTVIIVTGSETGKYWSFDEWCEDHKE